MGTDSQTSIFLARLLKKWKDHSSLTIYLGVLKLTAVGLLSNISVSNIDTIN